MQQGRHNRLIDALLAFLSLTGYLLLGYFTERHQTTQLLLSYFTLYIAYIILCYRTRYDRSYTWQMLLALASRLCLIVAVPSLSDDVYRFIWDGELLAAGFDPFAETPQAYAEQGLLDNNDKLARLYPLLNSPAYFTIYPPLCQLIFYLSSILSPTSIFGSIIVIRLFILLAEGITLYFLPRLLKKHGLAERISLVYALNPLVILELTGNLHFEAWAVAGLIACLYFWKIKKNIPASFAVAAAILAKLLPLITLPLFLRRASFIRLALFFGSIGMIILLVLIPYLDSDLLRGMQESTSLYFNRFEFNASLYYVIRTIGYWYKGYNIIGVAGTALALVAGVGILIYTLVENRLKTSLPLAMMWVYALYYLFATTLHPWYVIMLIPLCLFGRWRFPVLWTGMVFLTYSGYTATGFKENLWLTALEYIVVFGWLLYEGVWDRMRGDWRLWEKWI
ncbi:hypothetical protein AB9P05_14925 [Roseivirga sp. BDSF3-8]|uniref:hypothetical protein n=1 Tax=Roseivirga sp. BDSF3-8 TaxID=3241598 RepID=UPI0035325399